MTKVKNTSDRKQFVHTTSGAVGIYPGKTRDVDLTEEGARFIDASNVLETGAKSVRKSTKEATQSEIKAEGE